MHAGEEASLGRSKAQLNKEEKQIDTPNSKRKRDNTRHTEKKNQTNPNAQVSLFQTYLPYSNQLAQMLGKIINPV